MGGSQGAEVFGRIVPPTIKMLKDNAYAKFDETLDIAINLGINPEKTDQNIRGVMNLPKGSGKKIRIAVMVKGDKTKEATEAGADIVGSDDLVQQISSGKINFDIVSVIFSSAAREFTSLTSL